jgi:hypothetical protein
MSSSISFPVRVRTLVDFMPISSPTRQLRGKLDQLDKHLDLSSERREEKRKTEAEAGGIWTGRFQQRRLRLECDGFRLSTLDICWSFVFDRSSQAADRGMTKRGRSSRGLELRQS